MFARLIANWVYGGFLAGLLLLLLTPVLVHSWPVSLVTTFLCLPVYMVHQYEEHGGKKKASAVLCDLENSGIDEPLRSTLLMLGKLTREHVLDADDMRAVMAAGASFQQIEDALAVAFSFNIIGRLADSFGFSVPPPQAFDAGAKYLLARGYR